ncbi:MAG: PilZ domain-containing protein [Pseudomonadota bacterium]
MRKSQRAHERLPINAPVEYEGFERFHPDRISNISAGGAYIVTAKPLPINKLVTLTFSLPDLPNSRIRATGTVVWTPQTSSGTGARHPMGMGIEFDDSNRDLLRLLDQYVTVSSGLRSVDTRIGFELPAHLRSALSTRNGISPTVDVPDTWTI